MTKEELETLIKHCKEFAEIAKEEVLACPTEENLEIFYYWTERFCALSNELKHMVS